MEHQRRQIKSSQDSFRKAKTNHLWSVRGRRKWRAFKLTYFEFVSFGTDSLCSCWWSNLLWIKCNSTITLLNKPRSETLLSWRCIYKSKDRLDHGFLDIFIWSHHSECNQYNLRDRIMWERRWGYYETEGKVKSWKRRNV